VQFSPSVYEHCALLIGRTPWNVSRDGELLYQAKAEAGVDVAFCESAAGIVHVIRKRKGKEVLL
jgi:hypothetical protein